MEILQIEEYVKTKMINILDLEFVKTKVNKCHLFAKTDGK